MNGAGDDHCTTYALNRADFNTLISQFCLRGHGLARIPCEAREVSFYAAFAAFGMYNMQLEQLNTYLNLSIFDLINKA